MTYTFKLARRIARLRAPLAAALLVALSACDSSNSFDPDQSSNTNQGSGAASGATASAYAGGIPFGMFAMPDEEFGTVYNGAMQNNAPQLLLQSLAQIKARGGKVAVMFAGQEDYYKEGGHFSFTEWKARIDRFKSVNFTSYINDGTIIGHYLIDEPNDPANWNGQPVPPSVLEEMARYSKQLWPDMVTIVRVEPGYLASNHQYLDAAWAQYLSRRGPADEYVRRNVADAQQRGLGLVVGFNLLKGGTPNGSRMTASEVESWGSALLSSTYPCAFISWTYDKSFLSSSGMTSAMASLRRQAQSRTSRTCRGSSSGGTPTQPPPSEPPPSEPPPSEPPPSEPPTPTDGVPFGPIGVPTTEIGSFTGGLRGATPENVLTTAAAARQAGAKVVLRLSGGDVSNANGTFSLTKWKAAVDRYARVNLGAYIADGTIAGHMLVQNPANADAWGGQRISYATLEQMAQYSRQRWPGLTTIVQESASWLAANPSSWQSLDAAASVYTGQSGEAGAWISGQANAAAKARLGLMVSMNVLNGGTSASRLPGTTQGKYAMSATQLRSWGSTLVAHSRVCGMLLSRYDERYFGRSDVRDALRTLATQAEARSAVSCRAR